MDRHAVYEIARQVELGRSAQEIADAMIAIPMNQATAETIQAKCQGQDDHEILLVACLVKSFSPKSFIISGRRATYGICDLIQSMLGLRAQQQATYRIKVAKELYQVDRVFKEKVDRIVKEVKNGS